MYGALIEFSMTEIKKSKNEETLRKNVGRKRVRIEVEYGFWEYKLWSNKTN